MRIARRKGREIDRAAAPGSVRAATSGPFLPRPGFKIFIYAFCAPTAPFRRTRATPSDAPQAARRAVRASATGRRTAAGGFSGNGTLFTDTQHYTQRIRASRHPPAILPCPPPPAGRKPHWPPDEPAGKPGSEGNKIFLHISCSYVAFCLPLPPEHYLSRQESYRPPPPLYPLPLPTPHGTRQPPPAQPTRLRASPSGHTSASKRAQACLTAGKGLRARGRRCARRPSHGKADGKEGYSIQEQLVRTGATRTCLSRGVVLQDLDEKGTPPGRQAPAERTDGDATWGRHRSRRGRNGNARRPTPLAAPAAGIGAHVP